MKKEDGAREKKKIYETGGFENSRVSEKKSRISDDTHLVESEKEKKRMVVNELKFKKTSEEYYKIGKTPSAKPSATQNSKTSRPKDSSILKNEERNKSKTPKITEQKTSPEDKSKFESVELKYAKPTK